MRRLISIALMLVLGLPLFASAWGQAHGTQLAACCRRGGAHQCMEMATASERPVVRMTCPAYPRGASTVQTGVWTVAGAGASVVGVVSQPAVVGQVEAGYRISFGRARQKRGPPVVIS